MDSFMQDDNLLLSLDRTSKLQTTLKLKLGKIKQFFCWNQIFTSKGLSNVFRKPTTEGAVDGLLGQQ